MREMRRTLSGSPKIVLLPFELLLLLERTLLIINYLELNVQLFPIEAYFVFWVLFSVKHE
jgi:hypothetical protein